MKYEVLQPYKDWMLNNRGEIRPEIGDKIIDGWKDEDEINKNNLENFSTDSTYFDKCYVKISYNPNEAIEFGQFIKDNLWKYGIKYISIEEIYKEFKKQNN